MHVDGREIAVFGSLLQPLIRRTNDILRLALSSVLLATVITSSIITRTRWDELERSISRIIGVLSPAQADLVYLVYGVVILALPFMILIQLIVSRQWKLLGAYAGAAFIAFLALSITSKRLAALQWHFDLSYRLRTVSAQVLDDPRWIAMLAAVLTVSGPWLPARWRRWWWTLLLAFVPIHLVVSAIVPARSLLGLAVGWFVGALVVLVSGTPALEVPLDGAVRAMAKRGFTVSKLTVVRPAGSGPLVLSADAEKGAAMVELYGPHQRSGGALRQLWSRLRLRGSETAPLQASMRRAVEHRALMAIAVGDLGVANTTTIAVGALDRGWTLYAHKPIRGEPIKECATATPVARVWDSLRVLHNHQISHGNLRDAEITVDDGTVLFGGFGSAEYGASDNQLQSDIAALLVTTSALYGADSAVGAAIDALGKNTVLTASRRLTKSAVPKSIRESVNDAGGVISRSRTAVMRQTHTDKIRAETITRFTRSQLIQL
ncbi:MAG: TIGR00374 family protein, partial [Mycobacterium sp.]|nr:TIGR00374 family protein [Mycobacterium sp.]